MKVQKLDFSKIADELCACGHKKSEHRVNPRSGAEGHGECSHTAEGCPCDKFTWVAFLDKNGKEL